MPYIPATTNEIARLTKVRGEYVNFETASLFIKPRPEFGQFELHFGRSCMQRKVSDVTSTGIVSDGELIPFCSTQSWQLEGRTVSRRDAFVLIYRKESVLDYKWVDDIFYKGTDPSEILQKYSEQILFQRAIKYVALRLRGKKPREKLAEALLPADLWEELSHLKLIYYDSTVEGYSPRDEEDRPKLVLRGLEISEINPDLIRVTFTPCSDSSCPVCASKERTMKWLDEMVSAGKQTEIPEVVLVKSQDKREYFVYHGNMRVIHAIHHNYPLRAAVIVSQNDFNRYLENNEPAWFGAKQLAELFQYLKIYATYPAANKHSVQGLPPHLRKKVLAIYGAQQTEAMNRAFGWDDDD